MLRVVPLNPVIINRALKNSGNAGTKEKGANVADASAVVRFSIFLRSASELSVLCIRPSHPWSIAIMPTSLAA